MKINSLRNFILEISNKKMFNFLNVFTKQKQILVFKALSKKNPPEALSFLKDELKILLIPLLFHRASSVWRNSLRDFQRDFQQRLHPIWWWSLESEGQICTKEVN